MKRWSVERVQTLLDFGCGARFGATSAMVRMQTEGVAAICEILRKRHVAYLADEVGLGKTMQALGVAACLSQGRPDSRVLVISPRKIVQNGWEAEHARFSNYVVKDASLGMPVAFHESLRDWFTTGADGPGIHLLRHSSFTRPIFNSKGTWAEALEASRFPELLRHALERQTPTKTGDNSRDYNLAFARGANAWLKTKGVSFNLVVVDEAQCLRNLKHQQTNSVLQALLADLGENWLFLSATPAHSGVHNIRTVLNEYAGRGRIIEDECVNDPELMKARLKEYMIRRPRVFLIGDVAVHKAEYRKDDDESLKLHCQDPLSMLSIALVQKHLARALGGEGGRFRSGFIASFESLEDSLRDRRVRRPAAALVGAEAEEEQIEAGDFYMEHHLADETLALDEGYLSAISRDFQNRFGIGLPHPKLDGVEADLARHAFGDPASCDPGGTKTVVFCRRLSSVTVLRERLIRRYLASVRARCQRVWNVQLDWDAMEKVGGGGAPAAAVIGPTQAPSAGKVEWDAVNRVRQAQAEGNWLYKFRMTFADGRNALALELNWFDRLCKEAGVSVAEAAAKVPERLWTQSQGMATRHGRRYRAEQARCLTWLALKECGGDVFGFDKRQVDRWTALLRPVLGIPEAWAPTEQRAAVDQELLTFRSIWTLVEEGQDATMHLPGARAGCSEDAIHWRKIIATVIGQYLRLTDTAIDMYFAETKEKDSLQRNFTRWLLGADPDAVRLQQIWRDWISHHVLIFSSAVGEQAKVTPAMLAEKDSFDFLNSLDPVVGITGSAGGHKRALQQFNTPGMPFVMIGTDTIREGVNLHLFCDRVMHYGMPWTPGDMEQRIGRVDRFFGRIERRLQMQAPGAAQAALHILYPYLQDTVEQQQIRTVMHRRRESEAITDDAFGVARKDHQTKMVEIDAVLVPDMAGRGSVNRDSSLFGVGRHLKR